MEVVTVVAMVHCSGKYAIHHKSTMSFKINMQLRILFIFICTVNHLPDIVELTLGHMDRLDFFPLFVQSIGSSLRVVRRLLKYKHFTTRDESFHRFDTYQNPYLGISLQHSQHQN